MAAFLMEVEVITINELIYGKDPKDDECFDSNGDYNYCNWVLENGNYTPAINVSVVNSMKSGIYKVGQINNTITVIPQINVTDDLYELPDSNNSLVLKEVDKFWNRKEQFAKYKMIHKRGILLEGRPGMGKSSLITLLINQLLKNDGLVFIVNNKQDFSLIFDFYRSTLRKIEKDRHIITIIEDIDKLSQSALESELLDFLDGKSSIDHHVVIATTNDSTNLSDALLRPSRMDMRVIIDFPNDESRKIFFVNKGVEEQDIEKFVKETKDFSMSQLKELFIGTYVLGNVFEQVLDQIKNPLTKKRYDSFKHASGKLGF